MSDQPTPNSMPGAEPKAEAKAEAPKVETPNAGGHDLPGVNDGINNALSAEDASELARLRKIHADESKWEKRAKQNFEDAEKLRELMKSLGGEKSTEFDPKAAFDALNEKLEKAETERLRAEVARTEKVPPKYVRGSTEDEMRAAAQEYLADVQQQIDEALKAKNGPAAPPASTVTSNGKIAGPEQITTRDQLAKLSPADQMKAYQDGRLDSLMGKST